MNYKKFPRILISALRGSSAKTIMSLGITVALERRGHKVLPFKKGPDYIDASWLSKAAGSPCRHLDLYFMGEEGLRQAFYPYASPDKLALVEGNRGLFDGMDTKGTYSTASIAKILDIPVILVLDAQKITNTISTFVLGSKALDPKVPIKGVILNKVAGKRHIDILKKSIIENTGLPVLGAVPKISIEIPERHLGLVTADESSEINETLEKLGDMAEEYLDIEAIVELAKNTDEFQFENKESVEPTEKKVRVGIIRDKAFQFYYPENLETLEREGAELIEFDSMKDKELGDIDLLYIGGGFPEVFAESLSKNISFKNSIKNFADNAGYIYGECGAMIYLGAEVSFEGKTYEMCGVFPLAYEFTKKPAGHGYTEIEVINENPFFPSGIKLRGHEFHYSKVKNWNPEKHKTAFEVKRGIGLDAKRDGLFKKNVFLSYTHLHVGAFKDWAKYLLACKR